MNTSTETFDVYLHAPIPEPFETELRARLHDILEEWETLSDNFESPMMQAIYRQMIDQIDDAMYPPEDSNG